MKRKTKRIGLVISILVGAVGLMFGLIALKPQPEKKEIETLAQLVEVIELTTSTESFEIKSQGTVRPRTQTTVSAEVSGSIIDISPKFIAGGVFAAGETLLRIDPTDYKVALLRAEALVKQRQIEFDGAQKLRSQGYRAEAELAAAAAALASAQADLVSSQRNLERTSIRLPYEGMVVSKNADLGQFVSTGTVLGVTFATDIAEIRLPLTDQDLAYVDVPSTNEITRTGGTNGPRVTLSAIQKGQYREWDGVIVRSEGVVDERSRVTYAVASVSDPYRLHTPGESLPIGTFVSATIHSASAVDVIRVPRGAIRGSNQLLFVDSDNTIQIRPVQILRTDSESAFISGGASAGERITTTAIQAPTNGMAVRTPDMLDDAAADTEGAAVAVQLDEE